MILKKKDLDAIEDYLEKGLSFLSNTESQEKGTTVASSIGDDTDDRLSLQAQQAEDGKHPETVDGDPIGLNIETEKVCKCCGNKFWAYLEQSNFCSIECWDQMYL